MSLQHMQIGEVAGLDELDAAAGGESVRDRLIDLLVAHREVAEQRCAALREQLETAEVFATDLRTEVARLRLLPTHIS